MLMSAGVFPHTAVATRRRGGGFTLIEMMVTVAIVAILAALAAPSFSELIASQRARIAASDLFSSLLRARSEAIKRNRNVVVTAKAGDWANGWQVTVVNSTDPAVDDHGATSGLTVTGPKALTYQSSGRISGAAVSFQVTPAGISGGERCVEIDTSGRPTVRSGTC